MANYTLNVRLTVSIIITPFQRHRQLAIQVMMSMSPPSTSSVFLPPRRVIWNPMLPQQRLISAILVAAVA
jgi:hypothetical protein